MSDILTFGSLITKVIYHIKSGQMHCGIHCSFEYSMPTYCFLSNIVSSVSEHILILVWMSFMRSFSSRAAEMNFLSLNDSDCWIERYSMNRGCPSAQIPRVLYQSWRVDGWLSACRILQSWHAPSAQLRVLLMFLTSSTRTRLLNM